MKKDVFTSIIGGIAGQGTKKASIVEKYQTKGPDEGEVSSSDLNSCVQETADLCLVEVITVE